MATLALTAILATAVAAVNWRINFYGVFGDVRGQERKPETEERWSKYLFAYNYIPANFDALLVGNSISIDLDSSRIRGYRMYNTSIKGGNATEERLIAEAALAHGQFRLVVFTVEPYMLASHERKGGGMQPRDVWSALGSWQLGYDSAVALARSAHLLPDPYSSFGVYDFRIMGAPTSDADLGLRSYLHDHPAGHRAFLVDEIALRDFAAVVQTARDRGARVAVFFAPQYAPKYQALRAEYAAVEQRIRPLFKPDEVLADFNDGSYGEITGQPAHFFDGVHMSPETAAAVVRVLDEKLNGPLPGPGATTATHP